MIWIERILKLVKRIIFGVIGIYICIFYSKMYNLVYVFGIDKILSLWEILYFGLLNNNDVWIILFFKFINF